MPHSHRRKIYCDPPLISVVMLALACFLVSASVTATTGDTEYVGSLDSELVADTEELDQVVFHPLRDLSKVKFATPPESGGSVTAGRLYDPLRDKSALLAVLAEPEDGPPLLYADLDGDGAMADAERFELQRGEEKIPISCKQLCGCQ